MGGSGGGHGGGGGPGGGGGATRIGVVACPTETLAAASTGADRKEEMVAGDCVTRAVAAASTAVAVAVPRTPGMIKMTATCTLPAETRN